MPKVEINKDEWYPVLSIASHEDEDTGERSYLNGSCDVPDEFIEEYEAFLKHYKDIQDRLETYARKGEINAAKEELCKYVDANIADKLASEYACKDRRMVSKIKEKEEEVRYVVFKSRVAIKGTAADKEAAIMDAVKEWILTTYQEKDI